MATEGGSVGRFGVWERAASREVGGGLGGHAVKACTFGLSFTTWGLWRSEGKTSLAVPSNTPGRSVGDGLQGFGREGGTRSLQGPGQQKHVPVLHSVTWSHCSWRLCCPQRGNVSVGGAGSVRVGRMCSAIPVLTYVFHVTCVRCSAGVKGD